MLWWIVLSILAAGIAVATAPYVAQRGGRKPVAFNLDDEATCVAGVWSEPSRWAYLSQLQPEDFSSGTYRAMWQAMSDSGRSIVGGSARSDEEADQQGALLSQQGDTFRSRVRSQLSDRNQILLGQLDPPAGDDPVLASAQSVMSASMERVSLTGASLIVPSDYPDSTDEHVPPVRRIPAPVTVPRRTFAALSAAVWVMTSFALLQVNNMTGAASALSVLSWLALGAGMLVVAFVDYDTMFIDMPAWFAGTLTSWLLAIAAALLAGDASRLIAGVVMVVAVAAAFELLNLAYRLFRGTDGQGFGDTLIVIGTVGLPPALTGVWTSGYVSVMAAMLAAIAVWIVVRLRGQADRDTPFAFGPWLTLGPVAALWWLAASGTFPS